MDTIGRVFSILFSIGFIFFSIDVLTSRDASFNSIFIFVIVPLLIVIGVTLKNRGKNDKQEG